MKKTLSTIITILFALVAIPVCADSIDDLEALLKDQPQVQEKIYIHTDNTCYFIGDTLWYKAYVLRSDDLKHTDMSKLLYVELLSPDGIVVERQRVVISEKGVTCGQFELKDSLYSGYYELRAYTRWQLNFNVEHKDYSFLDARKFYGKQFAKDFYRQYEGLYSRVLPVYAKPKDNGNWSERYMFSRPKQRILKENKFISCYFYPEGGQLVEGLKTKVAFEIADNNGQAMDLDGTLSTGQAFKASHMGRGILEITPGNQKIKATIKCDDKEFKFTLPEVQPTGTVLNYDAMSRSLSILSKGVKPAAMAVLCRGCVSSFRRLDGGSSIDVKLTDSDLATGINEIIVYDADAQPLASRLIFANKHDMESVMDASLASASPVDMGSTITNKTTVAPFQPVDVTVKADNGDGGQPLTVSVAVRDASTDEPGYDDGNIMTDMLLSGDLRGFVASPAYYFASEDEEHTKNLDLLLMVQGWRKYKRVENMRYMPERGLTYEGRVLKMPSEISLLELTDLASPTATSDKILAEMETALNNTVSTVASEDAVDDGTSIDTSVSEEVVEYAGDSGFLHSKVQKKPVYVEAELYYDGKVAGAVTESDGYGRFTINLPPFYDQGILFVKAYNKKDSLDKCLTSDKADKYKLDERAIPDFYIKRDMFFPVFSKPYSWYQVNSPDLFFLEEDDDELIPQNSKLAGNHTLQTVIVKAKRRGTRRIDKSKPAIVRDAYGLFNDVVDYGLSAGVFNGMAFPSQISTLLFGNMGRNVDYNIRGMVEETTFYRNYTESPNEYDKPMANMKMFQNLALKRMQNVKVYTDYELRTDSGTVYSSSYPDVTLVIEPVADDGKRYTYRDRRYILDGITYPEQFYNRTYQGATPQDPEDYRRTLYWNPNARLDEEGKFSATLYNNSKETRLRVSAAGVGHNGKLFYTK